jgi:hypothetical protein
MPAGRSKFEVVARAAPVAAATSSWLLQLRCSRCRAMADASWPRAVSSAAHVSPLTDVGWALAV